MRIGFEIIAILEGAGLALVAIDRHQPRPGLAEHRAPFASGRKAGAAEAAQARRRRAPSADLPFSIRRSAGASAARSRRLSHRRRNRHSWADARGYRRPSPPPARSHGWRGRQSDGRPRPPARCRSGRRRARAPRGCRDRRCPAIRCSNFSAPSIAQVSESQTRMVSGGILGSPFLHDIEMRVEGRGLEHFRKRQLHLVGERGEMGGGNLVISVLDQMQMLDQEVAPPRPVAEQKFDLMRGGRIDLATLGGRFGPLASLAGMFERADLLHIMTHWNVSLELLVFARCRPILVCGMPHAKKKEWPEQADKYQGRAALAALPRPVSGARSCAKIVPCMIRTSRPDGTPGRG